MTKVETCQALSGENVYTGFPTKVVPLNETHKFSYYHSRLHSHFHFVFFYFCLHLHLQSEFTDELENVQKRAARFVTRNYSYETGSMTGILEELKWETLQKRRKDNRLILLYKLERSKG